ncbi:MAG: hypothetical protein MUF21_11770 [Gemmatimonadaceae bacterium]|nr:hypothetical protein [Gemmatimonadaceae bacterium]
MRQPRRLPRPELGTVVAHAVVLTALLVAAPTRGAAQQGVRHDGTDAMPQVAPLQAPVATQSAAPAPAATVKARAARVVGEYVVRHARREFPQSFTIADSAGRLIARYRMAGDAQPREMQVEVVGADLVLRAETADGPLMVVLDRQADGVAAGRTTFSGRWYFQGAEGVLQGRSQP